MLLAETSTAAVGEITAYQVAIGALSASIVVLFGMLIQSKGETTAAYKEVLPTATLLMTTVEALKKLVERLEREREGGSA